MELIPILSFIILVATISTFILAIGAYILYKIRESKGRLVKTAQPKTVEAELYTPSGIPLKQPEPLPQLRGMPFPEQQQPVFGKVQADQQMRPAYVPQQPEQFVPQQGGGFSSPQQQQRFAPTPQPGGNPGEAPQRYPQQAVPGKSTAERKIMRYTSDGYVPVDKTKTGDNLKWR